MPKRRPQKVQPALEGKDGSLARNSYKKGGFTEKVGGDMVEFKNVAVNALSV